MSRGKVLNYFLQPRALPVDDTGLFIDVDAGTVYVAIEAILSTTGRSFWGNDAEYRDGYNRMVQLGASLLMDGTDRIIRALWETRSPFMDTTLDPTERGLYPGVTPTPSTIYSIADAVNTFNLANAALAIPELAALNTIIGLIDQIEPLLTAMSAPVNLAEITQILQLIDSRLAQDAGGITEDTVISQLAVIREQVAFSQQRLATIEGLLQTGDYDGFLEPGSNSITRILARGLLERSAGPGSPLETVAQILRRQLGGNTAIRLQDLYQLLPVLQRLSIVANAVDPANDVPFGPELISKVTAVRAEISSLTAQFATPDFPGPIRNRVEDIVEQLGSLNQQASTTATYSIQNRDLLSQLLACTPCSGLVPTRPTFCDAPASGFVFSTGWIRAVNETDGSVFYVARLEGRGNVPNLAWGVTTVSDAIPSLGQIDVLFVTNTSSAGGRRPFRFCISWEGDSGDWGRLVATPTLSAILFNATVELNSTAPANGAPTRQADTQFFAERSRWYITAEAPRIPDAPPPVNARVFIVPQVIA